MSDAFLVGGVRTVPDLNLSSPLYRAPLQDGISGGGSGGNGGSTGGCSWIGGLIGLLIAALLATLLVSWWMSSGSNRPCDAVVAEIAMRTAGKRAVVEVTDDEACAVMEARTPAIVLAYAPWCGFCKQFLPVFAAAAAESSILLVQVNADDGKAPKFTQKHAVRGFPTVWGVRADGKAVLFRRARTKEAVLQFAQELAQNTA